MCEGGFFLEKSEKEIGRERKRGGWNGEGGGGGVFISVLGQGHEVRDEYLGTLH